MFRRILIPSILVAGLLAFPVAGWTQYGLYALGSDTDALEVPAAVETNPYVDGIALRFNWSTLEPSDGQFAWASLDSAIQTAAGNGKRVSFSIAAGYATPDWVYAAGAKSFSYVWAETWGPTPCTTAKIPIPWDAVYLSKWGAFVAALGQRYDGNPTVGRVHVTGLNSNTEETFLPTATGGAISVTAKAQAGQTGQTYSCTANNDVQNWLAAGYTRTLAESVWKTTDTIFAAAFPDHLLGHMVVAGGFPPIDQNGKTIGHNTQDFQVNTDMLTEEYQTYGSRFFVQENGLSDFWCWQIPAALAGKMNIGFQMLSQATNDSSCRMNNGVSPCDPVTVLSEAIAKGIANGAHYLEIYKGDITNPNMQATLATAQRELNSRGLRPRIRP